MWSFVKRHAAVLVAAFLLTQALAVGTAVALARYVHVGPAPTETAADLRATIVSRPHTFTDGEVTRVVRPAELRRVVAVRGERVIVDAHALAALLDASFPPREAVSAELRTDADDAWVVPGRAGRRLDAARTARALTDAPRSTTHVVRFHVLEPRVTTSSLESLGIDEVVAEFTTRYEPGQPRVTNIKRAAELLDGTRLAAGERFSMNEALGERTVEKGFVPAPMIVGDRFVDSVGGGISQVATTLYNAAFFAGLELLEHQPHSLYIDRYPLGREATISWGGPELIFRNDWAASLLMRVVATDDAVTVRFYSSSLGRRVETETTTEEWRGTGITVHYTRRVYENERLVRDERFTTRYSG